MTVFLSSGEEHLIKMDIAPGFPGNPLTQGDHENHFWDCMDFASTPFPRERAEELIQTLRRAETLDDVRVLVSLLVI